MSVALGLFMADLLQEKAKTLPSRTSPAVPLSVSSSKSATGSHTFVFGDCTCEVVVDNARRIAPKRRNQRPRPRRAGGAGQPGRSLSTPAYYPQNNVCNLDDSTRPSSWHDERSVVHKDSRWDVPGSASHALLDHSSTAFAVTSPTTIRERRLCRWETERSSCVLPTLPLMPLYDSNSSLGYYHGENDDEEVSRSSASSYSEGSQSGSSGVVPSSLDRIRSRARDRRTVSAGLVAPQRQPSDRRLASKLLLEEDDLFSLEHEERTLAGTGLQRQGRVQSFTSPPVKHAIPMQLRRSPY